LAAVSALGLDFGAVDIIWNEREDKCYVLEVNTAPGLQGSTLENYANAIMEVL
jgi:glutathione synthase/RimK-type ligase-like ATP-grasp enzyme